MQHYKVLFFFRSKHEGFAENLQKSTSSENLSPCVGHKRTPPQRSSTTVPH
uniref:Uncharacterized protein n=1 Tax=Anguilla anguilla TaxID=7936 RepID=A0A0E9PXN8_ANGAN